MKRKPPKLKALRAGGAAVGQRVLAHQSAHLPPVRGTVIKVDPPTTNPHNSRTVQSIEIRYDDGCGAWHHLWGDCGSDVYEGAGASVALLTIDR